MLSLASGPKDVFKASDCGRQAADHPLERAPRGEKLPKRLPNGQGAAEAKAAALHKIFFSQFQLRWPT